MNINILYNGDDNDDNDDDDDDDDNNNNNKLQKQHYWALHTYFGKYKCKITIDSTLKLTI